MGIAQGANRFFSWKAQTAHGTKATGFATAVCPSRDGSIFEVEQSLKERADAINVVAQFASHYPIPKIVAWHASFYLMNATTAHSTVRDFLRCFLGRETIATGPPITHTFDVWSPLIDGGTDTGTVLYGRDLTLHDECDDGAGTKIYSYEAQDAVIEDIKITFNPAEPIMVEMSGMASSFLEDQTDITPTYPDGALLHWQHLRDPATSGLRIGSANPLTSSDKVIFSKAVLSMSQKVRYLPFCGLGTGMEVNVPDRDDKLTVKMDVTMDVKTAVASEYESTTAVIDWRAGTDVNVDMLAYLDANNIFQFKSSATSAGAVHRGAFWETFKPTAQGFGTMQFQGTLKMAPTALSDMIIKMTTPS